MARCVADLTAHQARAGHEVVVMRPPGSGDLDGWLSPDVTVLDWPVERQPGPSHVMAARRLAAVASERDVDVVHLHSAAAGLAGRLGLRGGRPTIHQPHAWSFLAASGPQRRLALAWERFAVRWSDAIVCVSEDERRAGLAAGVDGPLVVVPNGVDATTWQPADDADRRRARHALGLDDVPTVVCVGRLSHQKGQDLLAAAWPIVTAEIPEALLHLVGDAQDLSLPDVPGMVVHGPSTSVAQFYAAADVVVLPSRWEGLALTLLEAMATARSVVASSADGNVEVLSHHPTAVVDVTDPVALAAALQRRLRDHALRDAEGAANREAVVRDHALESSSRRITDLAESLALR